MSRLKAALSRQPDPNQSIAKAISGNYTQEIETRHQGAFAHLMQRAEAVFDALRGQLAGAIRQEVAAQMPTIPAPQITRIHETPITQVIEKPLERVIERVIEEVNDAPVRVLRDKHGLATRIIKGDVVYTVQRDEGGRMTGVKRRG